MGRLTKDAWNRSSLRTKEIEVEQLGGSVLIRELPADVSSDLAGLIDMVQIGREQRAKVDVALMERKQFAYGVVDDNHKQMFTEDEVEELQHKHGNAFKFVVSEIDQLSGVDKEAIKEANERFPSSGTDEERSDVGDGLASGDTGPNLSPRNGIDAAQVGAGVDNG